MEGTIQDPIVYLEEVSKTFGERHLVEQYLFKDVNLRIPENTFTALIGPSGSGKTTLLHLIAGLEKPTSGEVVVLDTPLSDLSDDEIAQWRLQHVGVVFQSYNLFSTLTARENIMFPLDLLDFDFEGMEHTADELLKLVGLEDHSSKLPNKLSGGEQQRLALARALAPDPPLLLLDEPSGNLDNDTRDQILAVLNDLMKKEKTIIVATHDAALLDASSSIYAIEKRTIKKR